MRTPTNKTVVLETNRVITYLNNLIPNMSDLTNPLRNLLNKHVFHRKFVLKKHSKNKTSTTGSSSTNYKSKRIVET